MNSDLVFICIILVTNMLLGCSDVSVFSIQINHMSYCALCLTIEHVVITCTGKYYCYSGLIPLNISLVCVQAQLSHNTFVSESCNDVSSRLKYVILSLSLSTLVGYCSVVLSDQALSLSLLSHNCGRPLCRSE